MPRLDDVPAGTPPTTPTSHAAFVAVTASRDSSRYLVATIEVRGLSPGTPVAAGASEDELVDPTARRQYEQRIRDLQSDIDDAEADHDSGRSELLHAELDALVEHLVSAVGVGGRTRRTTGTTERARSAVTRRIRSTIRHIGEVHPSLGAHLRRTVSTGAFCRYAPDPRVDWTIGRGR